MLSTEDSNVWYQTLVIHRCCLLIAMCDIRCLLYTDPVYWGQQCVISDDCCTQMLSTEDSNVWYQTLVIHRCCLLKTAICDIRCLLHTNPVYWRQQCVISDAIHRCYLLKTTMCDIRFLLFTNAMKIAIIYAISDVCYTHTLSTEDNNMWHQMLVVHIYYTEDSNV